MLNVALFNERSACPEDSTVEMLGDWESGFEFFDPVEFVSNDLVNQVELLTSLKHHTHPRTVLPTLRLLKCRLHRRSP